MTNAEVETILGPRGDYSTVNVAASALDQVEILPDTTHAQGVAAWHWLTDFGELSVTFDDSGHVLRGWYAPMREVNDTTWNKLVYKVKRQWHRWFPE
jgi:hypothetical protein